MGAIKRWPADIALSNCVRERANWTCEKCGKHYPEGHRGGLEASHYWGRAVKSTRWCGDNLTALCTGCHAYFTGRPHDHVMWMQEKLGEGMIEILMVKARELYKGWKRELPDIAQHYRDELKTMEKLRAEGTQGRIEFLSWN